MCKEHDIQIPEVRNTKMPIKVDSIKGQIHV